MPGGKNKNRRHLATTFRGKLSEDIMSIARGTGISKIAIRNGGPIQGSYLMTRKGQQEHLLNNGYILGTLGDYGLVRKAVGNRDIPVYQTEPDAIDRQYLMPIGNLNGGDADWYGNKGKLKHAGNYSSTVYVDRRNPTQFYQKAWDLNDYGGNTGAAKKYNAFERFAANIADFIGNPVVQTTGYQKIEAVDPREKYSYNGNEDDNTLTYNFRNSSYDIDRIINGMLNDKGYVIEYFNGEPVVISKKLYDNPPKVVSTKKRRRLETNGQLD